jgi:hypothetical protein
MRQVPDIRQLQQLVMTPRVLRDDADEQEILKNVVYPPKSEE